LFVYPSHHATGMVGKTSGTERTQVKRISGRSQTKGHLTKIARKPRRVVLVSSNRKQGRRPSYQFAVQPLSLVTDGYTKVSFRGHSLVLTAPGLTNCGLTSDTKEPMDVGMIPSGSHSVILSVDFLFVRISCRRGAVDRRPFNAVASTLLIGVNISHPTTSTSGHQVLLFHSGKSSH